MTATDWSPRSVCYCTTAFL